MNEFLIKYINSYKVLIVTVYFKTLEFMRLMNIYKYFDFRLNFLLLDN